MTVASMPLRSVSKLFVFTLYPVKQLCDRTGAFRRIGLGDTGPTSRELPARFNSPMELANVNVPDFRRIDGLGGGGVDFSPDVVVSIPSFVMSDDRGEDILVLVGSMSVSSISISTSKLRVFLSFPRFSGGSALLLDAEMEDENFDEGGVLFSADEMFVPSTKVFKDMFITVCSIAPTWEGDTMLRKVVAVPQWPMK
ncbi:hypothetical protein IV203_030742 [Nitzschia inconspicua]|uniref:Uncharacterized protein n=1 Tax=Nitzschia inconspicua TaxID=303405 RepID=A0A9K3LSY5_9STRA|nr:hypothetical protein IV203_030742 [Nitzschia inconspicua]